MENTQSFVTPHFSLLILAFSSLCLSTHKHWEINILSKQEQHWSFYEITGVCKSWLQYWSQHGTFYGLDRVVVYSIAWPHGNRQWHDHIIVGRPLFFKLVPSCKSNVASTFKVLKIGSSNGHGSVSTQRNQTESGP